LLNDFELIPLKQKNVELAFLDPQKISEHKKQWQSINIGIPVVILLALAYMNRVRRERKYGQTVDKFVSKNNQ
jgi:ABC-2 type transport system permease protein